MTTATTIRWDSDEKRDRVEALARREQTSVNRLINRLVDAVLTAEAAEASFRAAARRGDPRRTLALLDRLDAQDRAAGIAGTKP